MAGWSPAPAGGLEPRTPHFVAALPSDAPSIAVIDEVPWIVEQDAEFEGPPDGVGPRTVGQTGHVGPIGSDLSVMEALTLRRPFFGGTEDEVRPLHLGDVAR